MHFFENITNHEVEECVSQSHRCEETESYVLSDENNGVDLPWHEDASNESESDSYVP